MNLPQLSDLKVKGKRILLRLDLDVPVRRLTSQGEPVENGKVTEDYRLKAAIPTIEYLLGHGCGRIVVLGHRGRPFVAEAPQGSPRGFSPRGKPEGYLQEFSLAPVAAHLEKLLGDYLGKEQMRDLDMYVMENLRFNPGEEENSEKYAANLAEHGDVYVNDAFGVCHREEASVVGLPKLMPHAAGLRLVEEIDNLEKVLAKPKRPVVMVIGGGKYDKVMLVEKLFKHADEVLVGGVLPHKIKSYCRDQDGKMCIVAAHTNREGSDITPDSARNFAEIIKSAETIVWNGPMGDIDRGHWEGTEIVAEAIALSRGFKVAGGGDTIHAIHKLGISAKIDFISTGGGAMLEFLAFGDLPGLAALQ